MKKAAFLLLGATMLVSSRSAPEVLVIPPDGVVGGEVNGLPVHWQMRADASSGPVLDAASAVRADLKPSFVRIGGRFGSATLMGRTAVINYAIDGHANKRRGVWFDAPIAKGAAGVIGPRAAPQQSVRFVLRGPVPGERDWVLPLEDHDWQGMSVRIGDTNVQFDVLNPMTYGTASTGAILAESHQGAWGGAPAKREIRFGVVRPVRRLTLGRPFVIGPISLTSFDVRTADYGSTAGIADGDPDPAEIVVVADSGKNRAKHSWLHLGRDALGRCSSLTFDKPGKRLVLRCAGN